MVADAVGEFIGLFDWRYVLLATAVCFGGFSTGVETLNHAMRVGHRGQLKAAIVTSLAVGLSAWAGHFVLMLSLDTGYLLNYAPGRTLISFTGALSGTFLGVCIFLLGRNQWWRLLGVMVVALTVARVHYLAVAAIRSPIEVNWNLWLGFIATLAPVVTFGIGSWLNRRLPRLRTTAAAAAGALGFLLLHLISLPGLTLTAVDRPDPILLHDTAMLWAAVGVIALLALGGAALATLSYWSRLATLRELREAIDAMPDGLGFFDANDRLVLWNAKYAEVNPELRSALRVGQSFREILQIGINEGLYAEAAGREEEWIQERMEAHRNLSNTMEQRIAGDRWLRVQDRMTSAGGIVTVVNDITDLKRDAQALAEARDAAESANRAKSLFLANMSHEIRTPLNGVIGLAQALSRTELTPTQTEMLALIESSGKTLQTLLSDILDLARVESGRLELSEETFDLEKTVNEAARLYAATAEEKGLRFFVEVAPDARVWIAGDPVRLKQVLTNLVSNAVKFTSAGFVGLNVDRGPDRDGSPTLRFSVEDTGIGFDSATRERLFSRFEQADGAITRRFGGSGLGLAISRQLADMMGGDLDCESEPGGGSAFILTLPMKIAAAPGPAAAVAEHGPSTSAGRRILVADDHPTNRKVVELILAQADVELTMVEDGAQALAAARSQPFDLILMDMQMPVMDGLTAVREIRLHEATMGLERTPIVMLTANALPEHIAGAREAGADLHLAKPFNAAELLGLVTDPPLRVEAVVAA